MLDCLVQECVRQGHRVTVICSKGSYDGGSRYEDAKGKHGEHVIRLGASAFGRRSFVAKLLDYLSFYASLKRALDRLEEVPDIVMALTTPPYIGWLARHYARKKSIPHAHWVMDLYPDVMNAHGMLRKGNPFYRWLARLSGKTFSDAAAVFALGPDMKARIGANYSPSEERVHSIPLWYAGDEPKTDTQAIAKLRETRGWAEDLPVFLYAGNMGVGHSFDEFFEVIKEQKGDSPRWVFSGGGKRRGEVEQFANSHPDLPIDLCDYVPQEELTSHLLSAQVHLASLRSGWEGTMVPSKIAASFSLGKPVLFIGSETSSPGIWIKESGGGWIVPPGNIDLLKQAVAEASDPQKAQKRGKCAKEFSELQFNRSDNTRMMLEILEGVL